ncbi:MAG: hypothetical protein M3Z28_06380, partial [Candidatus Dormibacteraeota bacterium]|nr:hypothetical protein [Candidatus Dormibacteraeota bacterium]
YVVLIAPFYPGVMYDVAGEHAAAIGAAIILLISLLLTLRLLSLLAHRRVGRAVALLEAYRATSGVTKLTAVLMLVSGVIHLALIPSHEGITGVLFVINGAGFIVLGVAALFTSWWRRPAILWLLATIVAYVVWVVAGWETPDQIGIACKLIELVALGLAMRLAQPGRRTWPRRIWRAVAFPMLASLATIGIWVGGLGHPDALHAHAGALLQPVTEVATPKQREAAARLLSDTRASIARYREPAAAIAAGYKPGAVSSADPLRHFENQANADAIFDPNKPQALVYAQTKHGLQLIGAMYQMKRAGQWDPDPGGPLTQWHQHEGICFSPFGFEFSFETPFWTCPVGSTSITTPPMLHVWIIDNGKEGPFAADLDKSVQKQLQGS